MELLGTVVSSPVLRNMGMIIIACCSDSLASSILALMRYQCCDQSGLHHLRAKRKIKVPVILCCISLYLLIEFHDCIINFSVAHHLWCFKLCGEWQDSHSLMYICTYSILMSSQHLTGYLKNTNENFQKIPFLMHSSQNFTPRRKELRYHCCLSQLYFIGH
jgi:hypothetical protein